MLEERHQEDKKALLKKKKKNKKLKEKIAILECKAVKIERPGFTLVEDAIIS